MDDIEQGTSRGAGLYTNRCHHGAIPINTIHGHQPTQVAAGVYTPISAITVQYRSTPTWSSTHPTPLHCIQIVLQLGKCHEARMEGYYLR